MKPARMRSDPNIHHSYERQTMSKILSALIAFAFAFGVVGAQAASHAAAAPAKAASGAKAKDKAMAKDKAKAPAKAASAAKK